MNAIYIHPQDIGCGSSWDKEWADFCEKFGYERTNTPEVLLLVNIKH